MLIRVSELIDGRNLALNLTKLYLHLRDRSYGLVTVQEIGHFIAHNDERDVGPTTQKAKDFFLNMRFHLEPILSTQNIKKWSPECLPMYFADYLESKLGSTSHKELRSWGFSKREAKKIIRDIQKALSPVSTDRCSLASYLLNPRHKTLIDRLCRTMTVPDPIFIGHIVVEELTQALIKNKLLQSYQRKEFYLRSSQIQLFAASLLSNCSALKLSDMLEAKTWLSMDEDAKLCVYIVTPCAESVRTAFKILSTSVRWSEAFDNGPLQMGAEPGDHPVELEPMGKLRIMT